MHDRRASQYWDPGLFLSRRFVEDARSGKLKPLDQEMEEDTIIWDAVALFAPGALWEDSIPEPLYYGYPVITAMPVLQRRLDSISSATGGGIRSP